MLPWLAFSEAVGRSPYVMVEHRNFVRKLVFAVETLPVNLVVAGVPITVLPAPNTSISLPGFGHVVLNEQITKMKSRSASFTVKRNPLAALTLNCTSTSRMVPAL